MLDQARTPEADVKHWILIGCVIIVACVLLFRSRTGTNATTLPTPATVPAS